MEAKRALFIVFKKKGGGASKNNCRVKNMYKKKSAYLIAIGLQVFTRLIELRSSIKKLSIRMSMMIDYSV